eukprot:2576714-Rhodomonas_salina.1
MASGCYGAHKHAEMATNSRAPTDSRGERRAPRGPRLTSRFGVSDVPLLIEVIEDVAVARQALSLGNVPRNLAQRHLRPSVTFNCGPSPAWRAPRAPLASGRCSVRQEDRTLDSVRVTPCILRLGLVREVVGPDPRAPPPLVVEHSAKEHVLGRVVDHRQGAAQ